MREVFEDLPYIPEGAVTIEEGYRKTLNYAVFRCDKVHSEYENITIYIDRLSDMIRMVFARFLESVLRGEMTFKTIEHFAKPQNEAYSALALHLSQVRVLLSETGTTNGSVPSRQRHYPQTMFGPDSILCRILTKRLCFKIIHSWQMKQKNGTIFTSDDRRHATDGRR